MAVLFGEEVAISVPAQKLADIVKVLPDAEVHLTTPANNRIRGLYGRRTLALSEESLFPLP